MTSELWSWGDLVAAAGAVADGQPNAPVTGFSIDTRQISPGDVFVALKDQRDGHDFVPAAFAGGAAAALVVSGYHRQPSDGALLRVDDPLRALERIAVAARARLAAQARVVAVTGSAGKTGTKEMLRACLGACGKVHAADKSFNNHWGVPLTLARMPADSDFAVIEIGMNHAGEIRPLTRMARPHVAIITNVLPVHVGHFADGEIGIANAKAEILEGVEPGGLAILNRDSPHFERLASRAAELGIAMRSFGNSAGADVQARSIAGTASGTTVEAAVGIRIARYDLGAAGVHIAINSLAVFAALDALGVDLDVAIRPLVDVAAPVGRGARTRLSVLGGEVLLVDESYNANPASVAAAIAGVATVPRQDYPRRIVVLGDMLELGADAERYHLGLARPLEAAGIDQVYACGPNMRLLFETLPEPRRAAWMPDSSGLLAVVPEALRAGDVVMVKGSLGSRMGPIVEAIKKRFAAGPGVV